MNKTNNNECDGIPISVLIQWYDECYGLSIGVLIQWYDVYDGHPIRA